MTQKIKILIGDDTVEQGLCWASMLKQKGMFAVTRPRNGKVILESVKADFPDIAIIEAKMPELDAAALITEMKRQLSKIPIVIVVSNFDSSHIEREVMEAGARYYMVKPFEAKILSERIENLISGSADKDHSSENTNGDFKEKTPDDTEYVVTEIIHQIGIPAHIKGYHYLRTAIMLSIENNDMINSVTKLLYPTVAKNYSTTPSRVERAIRHAIEIAWDRGDVDTLNGFFGYTVHTSRGKPTNSEFIALISDKLRLKYKNKAFKIAYSH